MKTRCRLNDDPLTTSVLEIMFKEGVKAKYITEYGEEQYKSKKDRVEGLIDYEWNYTLKILNMLQYEPNDEQSKLDFYKENNEIAILGCFEAMMRWMH